MRTPEERAETVHQQVIQKIYWGASDEEVTHWLQQKHGIAGDVASRLLASAHRKRARAIRTRALVHITLSLTAILLVVAFFYVRYFQGAIFYGAFAIISTACAIGVGIVSIRSLIQNVSKLIMGATEGAVEE